jgi:hypothetical protein
MQRMKMLIAPAAALLVAAANVPHLPGQAATSVAFVTLRGSDTISAEQYTRRGNVITGSWIVLQPEVFVHEYVLRLGSNGLPTRYAMRVGRRRTVAGIPSDSVTVRYSPDSAWYEMSGGIAVDSLRAKRITVARAYPSLGGSVVSLDLALQRLVRTRADSMTVVFNEPTGYLTVTPILMRRFGRDSATIGNGVVAHFGGDGTLHTLHKPGLIVQRVSSIDTAALVRQFVAADASRLAADSAAAAARVEIALPASELDRFVGTYRVAEGLNAVVTRNGDHLLIQLGPQHPLQLHAETHTKFFFTEVNAEIAFESDSAKKVATMVVMQAGVTRRAPRVP